MGRQIGLRSAIHGCEVWLVDVSEEALSRARESLSQELQTRVERGELHNGDQATILGRLHLTTSLREGATEADLVIEAVPERLEIKREVFAKLHRICPARTILATNSSSLRISLIEDATQRLDRVLNLHFFAPVEKRPVVELMGGSATSAETIERVREFALSCGLAPLLVRRESTGFIFNRIWRAIKKECLRVVDEGVATHEDVDRLWMVCYGTPRGPFGDMDMIGLDVIRDIEVVYYRESGDESDAPPKVLLDKIARGEVGVKTGKGFYTYPCPAYEDAGWLSGNPRPHVQRGCADACAEESEA